MNDPLTNEKVGSASTDLSSTNVETTPAIKPTKTITHTPQKTNHEWVNVDPDHPCPGCGSTNGNQRGQGCTYIRKDHGIDAWMCRSGHPYERVKKQLELNDHDGYSVKDKSKNGKIVWLIKPGITTILKLKVKKSPPDTVHRVYELTLQTLSLAEKDYEYLKNKRKFTDEQIQHYGYKSLTGGLLSEERCDSSQRILQTLHQNGFTDAQILGVPGFVQCSDGTIHLAGYAGMVFPVWNIHPRTGKRIVVALRVRKHEEIAVNALQQANQPAAKDHKYSYLSSKPWGGPTPGNPVHIPPFVSPAATLRATEGEAKANIASDYVHNRERIPTGSMPGHSAWKACIDDLLLFNSSTTERFLLAFDSDVRTNPAVATSQYQAVEYLISLKNQGKIQNFAIETWDDVYGKGIDDVILHGHYEQIHRIDSEKSLEYAALCQQQATNFHVAKQQSLVQQPAALPLPQHETKLLSLKQQTVTNLLAECLEIGSDSELAHLVLKDLYQQYERIEYDRSTIWGYTHGTYRVIDPSRIKEMVRTYDGVGIGRVSDSQGKVFKANFTRMNGVYATIENQLKDAAATRDEQPTTNAQSETFDPHFEPGFFNNAPSGVAFRNCFVRLHPTTFDVEQLPHSPENRALFMLPFDYVENTPTPVWNKYLDDVWDSFDELERGYRVDFLEEWIGATLLGNITKHALCLFWIGPGSNGKSVGLDFISGMFPRETICSVPPQRWHNPFEVERIAGMRINICEESPNIDITGIDKFKAIIAGSPVEACKKHQDFYRFRPTAGHVFALNELHGTKDLSDGYWRRVAPMAFNRKFDIKTADVGFGQKLSRETSGVIGHAIHAASRLAKRGRFVIPQTIETLKTQWRERNNEYLQFIREFWDTLVEKHGDYVPGNAVYSLFSTWSRSNGNRTPPGNNKFSEELKKLGLHKRNGNRGTMWYKP